MAQAPEHRILIVEDDAKICALLCAELHKWGYQAEPVADFSRVVEEFAALKPHLVLMDVNLPTFDGFHWCKKIRELSNVPVLFLSSRDAPMDVVMAVGMGGDDYLTKPFSMEVLLAKVSALIRRAYSYGEAAPETIERGGAVLTLGDNTLRHGDKATQLTRNEFRILWMLMRKAGTIVTRERLMRDLWEDESFVDDNTLTVNVNRLRKKLADLGLEDYIATVKNQGYQVK